MYANWYRDATEVNRFLCTHYDEHRAATESFAATAGRFDGFCVVEPTFDEAVHSVNIGGHRLEMRTTKSDDGVIVEFSSTITVAANQTLQIHA
ncbi:MAG TPA: hypothetical protein VK638_36445 [Edaphobacter sp.]|nr:hypothetical protein [Edaphobacter sp.]